VEWTQLEVTRCLSLTYEFCGTSESPLHTIIHFKQVPFFTGKTLKLN
jgi:hypothetical protein